MAGFAEQVRAFTDKTERKLETAIRKISLDLFSEVILKTPVETGLARGSWQVAIGQVPTGTVEIEDKTGTITIGKVQAETLNLKAGQAIYLVSNLSYIRALEYGHSQQSPEGMVRITLQRYRPIVEAVARELNRQ